VILGVLAIIEEGQFSALIRGIAPRSTLHAITENAMRVPLVYFFGFKDPRT
jgi:hypothetical protein